MTSGSEAVHKLVAESGWSYPVTVRRLEREHGLANVPLDERDNSITLMGLLEGVDADRFDDRDDLARTLDPTIEAELRSRRTGIVGKLKRTFLGRR
jgi:hypothetical protein